MQLGNIVPVRTTEQSFSLGDGYQSVSRRVFTPLATGGLPLAEKKDTNPVFRYRALFCESMNELIQQLNLSVGITGQAYGAKLDLQGQYSSKSDHKFTAGYYFVELSFVRESVEIDLKKLIESFSKLNHLVKKVPSISKKGKKDSVDSHPDSADEGQQDIAESDSLKKIRIGPSNDFEGFYEVMGDEFVSRIEYGKKLVAVIELETNHLDKSTQWMGSVDLSAAFPGAGASVGIKGTVSKLVQSIQGQRQSKVQIIAIGFDDDSLHTKVVKDISDLRDTIFSFIDESSPSKSPQATSEDPETQIPNKESKQTSVKKKKISKSKALPKKTVNSTDSESHYGSILSFQTLPYISLLDSHEIKSRRDPYEDFKHKIHLANQVVETILNCQKRLEQYFNLISYALKNGDVININQTKAKELKRTQKKVISYSNQVEQYRLQAIKNLFKQSVVVEFDIRLGVHAGKISSCIMNLEKLIELTKNEGDIILLTGYFDKASRELKKLDKAIEAQDNEIKIIESQLSAAKSGSSFSRKSDWLSRKTKNNDELSRAETGLKKERIIFKNSLNRLKELLKEIYSNNDPLSNQIKSVANLNIRPIFGSQSQIWEECERFLAEEIIPNIFDDKDLSGEINKFLTKMVCNPPDENDIIREAFKEGVESVKNVIINFLEHNILTPPETHPLHRDFPEAKEILKDLRDRKIAIAMLQADVDRFALIKSEYENGEKILQKYLDGIKIIKDGTVLILEELSQFKFPNLFDKNERDRQKLDNEIDRLKTMLSDLQPLTWRLNSKKISELFFLNNIQGIYNTFDLNSKWGKLAKKITVVINNINRLSSSTVDFTHSGVLVGLFFAKQRDNDTRFMRCLRRERKSNSIQMILPFETKNLFFDVARNTYQNEELPCEFSLYREKSIRLNGNSKPQTKLYSKLTHQSSRRVLTQNTIHDYVTGTIDRNADFFASLASDYEQVVFNSVYVKIEKNSDQAVRPPVRTFSITLSPGSKTPTIDPINSESSDQKFDSKSRISHLFSFSETNQYYVIIRVFAQLGDTFAKLAFPKFEEIFFRDGTLETTPLLVPRLSSPMALFSQQRPPPSQFVQTSIIPQKGNIQLTLLHGVGLPNHGKNDCFFNALMQVLMNSSLMDFFRKESNLEKPKYSQEPDEQNKAICQFLDDFAENYEKARKGGFKQASYNHRKMRDLFFPEYNSSDSEDRYFKDGQQDPDELFKKICGSYNLGSILTPFEFRIKPDDGKIVESSATSQSKKPTGINRLFPKTTKPSAIKSTISVPSSSQDETTGARSDVVSGDESSEYTKLMDDGLSPPLQEQDFMFPLHFDTSCKDMSTLIDGLFSSKRVEAPYKYYDANNEMKEVSAYEKIYTLDSTTLKDVILFRVERMSVIPDPKDKKKIIETKIDTPLPPHLFSVQIQGISYKLQGFIVHHGENTHSGHYIAYVRLKNGWTEWNDANGQFLKDQSSASEAGGDQPPAPEARGGQPPAAATSSSHSTELDYSPHDEVVKAARNAYILLYEKDLHTQSVASGSSSDLRRAVSGEDANTSSSGSEEDTNTSSSGSLKGSSDQTTVLDTREVIEASENGT